MLGAFPLCVVSASAERPAPRCGVNLEAPQIASAVKSLRPAFRTINAAWAPNPYDGNYGPCATLSTALVTIEHATGSSPNQALVFHVRRVSGHGNAVPLCLHQPGQAKDHRRHRRARLRGRPRRLYCMRRSGQCGALSMDRRPRSDGRSATASLTTDVPPTRRRQTRMNSLETRVHPRGCAGLSGVCVTMPRRRPAASEVLSSQHCAAGLRWPAGEAAGPSTPYPVRSDRTQDGTR